MKAIASMDLNRVIGNKGELPWNKIPEDMKWFRLLTNNVPYQQVLDSNLILGPLAPCINGYLVMGNTTFNNVGVLPNRFTYVLTGDINKLNISGKDYKYVDPNDIIQLSPNWNKTWAVGGAKTYNYLMPYCDEVFLTIVLDEYDGDVFMPIFEDQFPNSEILKETKRCWFVRYWK